MFGIFGKRVTQKFNTVNLVGDGDDIDVLEEIEKISGIKFQDAEAEKVITVGNLYDLVKEKTETRPDFDPLWEFVSRIVRDVSCSKDPIDRETAFFREHAKERL